jgi:hypothetical protein
MIRDTNPSRFINRVQHEICAGAIVVRMYAVQEWRYGWWVRVYVCELALQKPKLLLTFGPVSEQKPPDLEE